MKIIVLICSSLITFQIFSSSADHTKLMVPKAVESQASIMQKSCLLPPSKTTTPAPSVEFGPLNTSEAQSELHQPLLLIKSNTPAIDENEQSSISLHPAICQQPQRPIELSRHTKAWALMMKSAKKINTDTHKQEIKRAILIQDPEMNASEINTLVTLQLKTEIITAISNTIKEYYPNDPLLKDRKELERITQEEYQKLMEKQKNNCTIL